MRSMAFEKMVLLQVKTEKRKTNGLLFTIFFEVNAYVYLIATGKNQYLKISPEKIEIFLQQYVNRHFVVFTKYDVIKCFVILVNLQLICGILEY